MYVASRSGQSAGTTLVSTVQNETLSGDRELTRRILYLGHPLITPSLPQQDPCSRRMREDMSTNRFTAIGTSEEGAGARIRLDLVRLAPQSAYPSAFPCLSKT